MFEPSSTLAGFHPLIARWFLDRIGQPTEVQERSWWRIASGEHVLITAPTGSGKTLAAFLWPLSQFATGRLATGHTSVLYVSPLRALNSDIRRNLLVPLGELSEAFENAGQAFPSIRVRTRSGDTPQTDRARMQRHPPEILITTPESLNLMLSSAGGRSMLRGISTVILDEVHAAVGNKRGAHLMTAVERLVPLSGEFQRIALSATVRPMETVAEFIGGFRMEGAAHDARYTPRPVALVRSASSKRYDIRVWFPEGSEGQDTRESIWEPLTDEFKRVIGGNRTTLLFANSRRLCEKLALKINSGEEEPVAYVHHGSLSREIRYEVERRLREGALQAIVATNSLELGIDIGSLDEVLLVQSPPSISSAIQRIGRAGHQVGEVCRGTIFPTHSQDLLEAAVLAAGITYQDLEEVRPVRAPLDVLAQVIVSMVGVQTWDIEELYAALRASYPYHDLGREPFDLVLNMLNGRYADSRVRELRPRVSLDRLDSSVVARKGALLTLYTSGGTIPDRGYFHLRHRESAALIGELDEEFVWEASSGQTFTLGAQSWRIDRITHNDVFVEPGNPRVHATPFWKAEESYRDFHFSERIGEFLETANEHLEEGGFQARLRSENGMGAAAVGQLAAFLKRQREQTGCDLPHRHHLLVEHVSTGPGGAPGNQLVLHTLWGGRVNRPFVMALDAAWEHRYGQRLETYTGNDCIVIQLPHAVTGAEVLSLVSGGTVESLLRKRLEGSGFFGARFRECAGRALLLPRNRFGERMPLWMNRLRSQKLLEAVLRYEDFPILLEAWRACLQDEFDLENLRRLLAEMESGVIGWSETHTSYPSPMAQSLAWGQTNQYVYMGDEPAAGTASRLRGDLLSEAVFTPALRPSIAPDLVNRFQEKRQRLAPGYSPDGSRDLVDWVKERAAIPAGEWLRLLEAIQRDHALDTDEILGATADRLVRIRPPSSSESLVLALETAPRVMRALFGTTRVPLESMAEDRRPASSPPDGAVMDSDPDELLTAIVGEWLQYYGPVTTNFIASALGVDPRRLSLALEDLADSHRVITGQLTAGGDVDEVCDGENFEVLLRLARAQAVPVFEPLPAESLPLFVAAHQGLTNPGHEIDQLFRSVEQLLCLPLPAGAWEGEILPARLQPYYTSWLDSIMQEGDLRWVGRADRRVAFCFDADLDLLGPTQETDEGPGAGSVVGVLPELGRYDFTTLLRLTGRPAAQLSERLWQAVWRGQVTNDTFAALRKGIQNRFQVPTAATASQARERPARARSGFARWKGSLPSAGSWFRLPAPETPGDAIEAEERSKDRARLLLGRYGILFREILEKEAPQLRWGSVFRALRLMELSGEVLAGYFFHGIPGPQFASHQAFRAMQRRLPEDAVYWLNATDPASFRGSGLEEITAALPRRVDGTHLVYCGRILVIISRRRGRSLAIRVPPDDGRLPEYFGFLRHLLARQSQPMRRVTIDSINGEEAAGSPYLDTLRTSFDVTLDGKRVIVYRRAG